MSLVAYSTCAIRFIPKDTKGRECEYSDRSLIQLRQHDNGDYQLEALDIANKKAEIFKILLKERDLYKFGPSSNAPDELRFNNGTYRLLLNAIARDGFHKDLRVVLNNLTSQREGSQNDNPKHANKSPSCEPKTSPIVDDQKGAADTLTRIHELSEYIRNGKGDKAVDLIEKLSSQGVKLQAKLLDGPPNDEEIRIQVKIDGTTGGIRSKNDSIDMIVYGSTTIHELRAIFQSTHQFPFGNQYFFVNGHLAHETSSMNDLNVQNQSLFVLLVTQ